MLIRSMRFSLAHPGSGSMITKVPAGDHFHWHKAIIGTRIEIAAARSRSMIVVMYYLFLVSKVTMYVRIIKNFILAKKLKVYLNVIG